MEGQINRRFGFRIVESMLGKLLHQGMSFSMRKEAENCRWKYQQRNWQLFFDEIRVLQGPPDQYPTQPTTIRSATASPELEESPPHLSEVINIWERVEVWHKNQKCFEDIGIIIRFGVFIR